MKRTREDAWLMRVAKQIAKELRVRSEGTKLRVRQPRKAHSQPTGGWSAHIGGLIDTQVGIEIWLDRFTGHADRKFYACFYSKNEKTITSLAYRSKTLWPVREVKDDDLSDSGVARLKAKLAASHFNAPVLENYRDKGHHFFGIFDRTQGTQAQVEADFCELAVGFFLDVARSLPKASAEDTSSQVYARFENRKWVKRHLARERSGLLAAQCKERDEFCCQVCAMKFADAYGRELGARFAEAHHTKPLGAQGNKVKTNVDDLITVCSNCHRMLHRMNGKSNDIATLRRIYKRHQVKPGE